jgi:hypothetical protein
MDIPESSLDVISERDAEYDSYSVEEYDDDACGFSPPSHWDTYHDSYDCAPNATSGPGEDDRSESSSTYGEETLVSSQWFSYRHECDESLLGVEYYTESDEEEPTYRESDEAFEAYDSVYEEEPTYRESDEVFEAYDSDYEEESDGPTYDVNPSYDY